MCRGKRFTRQPVRPQRQWFLESGHLGIFLSISECKEAFDRIDLDFLFFSLMSTFETPSPLVPPPRRERHCMDDINPVVSIDEVNHTDEPIALTASLYEPFLIANIARVWAPGISHNSFRLVDGHSVLGGMIQVPLIPPEFVPHEIRLYSLIGGLQPFSYVKNLVYRSGVRVDAETAARQGLGHTRGQQCASHGSRMGERRDLAEHRNMPAGSDGLKRAPF